MDEQPNVNNLNGVPNFGHGLPSDVPMEVAEEAVVAAEPEAAEVEITSTNAE
jgi:hypothetical protein